MNQLCLWMMSTLAQGADVQFHPNAGDEWVRVDVERLSPGVLAHVTDRAAVVARHDVASLTPLPGPGTVVMIQAAPGVSDVELANALHGQPEVRWAHPDLKVNFELQAVPLPDDPYLDEQWHLINDGQRGYIPGVDINVVEAWEITAGAGILVAVIDTGVDIDHPDLVVLDGNDYADADSSSDPGDGNNHGTAVAGIIAAVGDNGVGTTGIAHQADVYGIRLINGTSTLSATFASFAESVDAGAHVINNSWGLEGDCDGFSLSGSLQDAFDYAEEEGRGGLGAVTVFAAGNDACDVEQNGILAHPAVIGVAAVGGFDTRENYSNFGTWVDIAAPSGGIVTTDIVGAPGGGNVNGDNDYTSGFGGTSAASPMVAGVAALMIAANPRLEASQVRDVLCDTAVRIDLANGFYNDQGWSPLYGCGRVDAGAAVRAVANLGPPEAIELALEADADVRQVLLSWDEPVDPDGDVLRYRVRFNPVGAPELEVNTVIDSPWVDLTGTVAVGDVIEWRVRAIDLWGPGDWSETQLLTVVEADPTPARRGMGSESGSGCHHAGSVAWMGLMWLPLFVRRRK